MTGLCERSALAVGFTADGDLDHLDSAVASALYSRLLKRSATSSATPGRSAPPCPWRARVHTCMLSVHRQGDRDRASRDRPLHRSRRAPRTTPRGRWGPEHRSEPGNGTRIEATARAHGLITGGDAEPDVDDGPDVDDDSALAGAARRRMS